VSEIHVLSVTWPRTKAAVNAPHSKRFAKFDGDQSSRSAWTAVALAPLLTPFLPIVNRKS